MGLLYPEFLTGDKVYTCADCGTHLTACQHIISKSFHAQSGKAYLFSQVKNVRLGEKEEKWLMTGKHVVSDAMCSGCDQVVGWTYHEASDESQRYKIGKFVLEKAKLGKLLQEFPLPLLKCEELNCQGCDAGYVENCENRLSVNLMNNSTHRNHPWFSPDLL